jgi:tetratricopeptide (TPR) repeat protein
MPRATATACPAPDQLESLADGTSDASAFADHLAACAGCRAALDRIRAENDLIAQWRDAAHPSASAGGPSIDAVVAGYEIIREIHRGGQGVVFEAMQQSTRRRVALKLALRGRFSTTRQRLRFEREVEVVASLRHPNIVTLFESGVTRDGSAYFAMEFVEGRPLPPPGTETAIDIEATLRLFATIARAVAHAHQRGIIHRDLKPSNILVDVGGQPHVLDFGLARVEGDDERGLSLEAAFLGTFAYAAPEQLAGRSGQVDVRADVYALGVMLYESLTGASPHPGCETLAALIECKGRLPRHPRAVHSRLDRDTDTIIMKALAPDPQRRYQSAAELADDLERRLGARPIAARGDSPWYVLGKAAQRHPWAIAASLVAAGLLLTAAIALSILLVQHDRQAVKAIDTLRTFREALAAADPLYGLSADASLGDYLHSVGRNVDEHLDTQPDSAAAVHNSLGAIALNMADYPSARDHFSRALDLSRAAHADDHPLTAESLHNLARVDFYLGQYQAAHEKYADALAMRLALHGEAHADVANTLSHLGSCLRRLGKPREAERLFRRSLAIREALPGAPADEIAAGSNNLGSLLLDVGDVDQALAMFDRALQTIERAKGPDDWRVAHALRNRAMCRIELGNHASAWEDLQRSERIWSALVDELHPALASVHHQMARAAIGLGRLNDAERLCLRAITARETRLASDHPDLRESLELLEHVRGRLAAVENP